MKQRTGYKLLMIARIPIWTLNDRCGAPSLYETLKGYEARGWIVFFLTLQRDGSKIVEKDIFKNIYIKELEIPLTISSPYLTWYMKVIRKFLAVFIFPFMAIFVGWKIIKEHDVDIIYGYEVYGILAAWVLSKLFGRPLVSRFQGTLLVRYLFPKRLFALLKRFEQVIAFKLPANLYIITDDGTQGDLVLSTLNPAARLRARFWRNGLNTSFFRPCPSSAVPALRAGLGVDNDHIVLLSLSRLERWKRVDRAISALPQIIREEKDVRLIIVGDGEERESLEELAKTLGVDSHVQFKGKVPHDRVVDYINAADIFISVYDFSNVGNPLLEAMSCGRCIVTLNSGTTGELIKDGETGMLLDAEQLDRLPEIIVKLIRDPNLRRVLGENARRFAEANFWTWEERMQAEVEEVTRLAANYSLCTVSGWSGLGG